MSAVQIFAQRHAPWQGQALPLHYAVGTRHGKCSPGRGKPCHYITQLAPAMGNVVVAPLAGARGGVGAGAAWVPGSLLELETAQHCFEVLRIDSIEITVGGF